jgi:phage-related protein
MLTLRQLKKTSLLAGSLALVAFLSLSVFATPGPQAHKTGNQAKAQKGGDHITELELKHFDEFLDKHADIRRDLARDPKLVDNPDYLANHPELDGFLKGHGGVRGELLKHPQEFIAREKQYEHNEDRSEGNKGDHITNLELKHFDEFLDQHAAIRKDLTRDPKLADNADYLVNHPDLDSFLKAHGGVRGELLKHPQEFMQREKQYEKKE